MFKPRVDGRKRKRKRKKVASLGEMVGKIVIYIYST